MAQYCDQPNLLPVNCKHDDHYCCHEKWQAGCHQRTCAAAQAASVLAALACMLEVEEHTCVTAFTGHTCREQEVRGTEKHLALSQANAEATTSSRLQADLARSRAACQELQQQLADSHRRCYALSNVQQLRLMHLLDTTSLCTHAPCHVTSCQAGGTLKGCCGQASVLRGVSCTLLYCQVLSSSSPGSHHGSLSM